MEAGETLTFDWKVSSENYDKLGFYVNNQLQGSQISGAPDWETKVFTAPSSGTYTFEWRYKKDASVHALDDCGYVDNVSYSGDALPGLPGDANGSGAVDSVDALLIFRYALGLEDSLPAFDNADVTGDGLVDAEDALMVFRYSLGMGDL